MSSAKDQMTKMLDQLMGQNRDGKYNYCSCYRCVEELSLFLNFFLFMCVELRPFDLS